MKSLIFLALFSLLFAQEDLSKVNPVTARGFFKAENLKPGQLEDLVLELDIQEGFTAYHDRFRLKTLTPENAQVGELNLSPIIEFEDKISKKTKKGVREKATITTQVEIPSDADSNWAQFDFELTYIACTEKYCLTPRKVVVAVDVEGRLPANTEKNETTALATTESIQKQIDENLAYALILIFLFGLFTSLTPCVYPLIPITMAVLGTKDNRTKTQSFLVSSSYVLGIGITYALLGVIAAQTGQLFGSFISHPAVIITMSLIFFVMGLSLLGLFELQAPAFIRNKMSNANFGRGYGGAFISGLLAGVVASPCVGPVLVGVLAYIAKTQDSALGFLLLFTFAMGFGFLFILLGTFSQMANKLPRSGAWMNAVKTVLALMLFGLSFWYAWPLAKNYLPENVASENVEKVKWQKFSPALVEKAKADNKPVIIDFYADWCAACVEMDQLTFVKKPVIDESEKFVMLKVDATSPFDELADWQAQYKVYGLPTMIFINAQGEVQEDLTLTGFEEAPLFLERMKKVFSN